MVNTELWLLELSYFLPYSGFVPFLLKSLRSRGIRFPGRDNESLAPIFTPPRSVSAPEVDATLAHQIQPDIPVVTFTAEQTKEAFDVARNSIELLSTVLSSSPQQDVLKVLLSCKLSFPTCFAFDILAWISFKIFSLLGYTRLLWCEMLKTFYEAVFFYLLFFHSFTWWNWPGKFEDLNWLNHFQCLLVLYLDLSSYSGIGRSLVQSVFSIGSWPIHTLLQLSFVHDRFFACMIV